MGKDKQQVGPLSVVVIHGSPRRRGNTDLLLDRVALGTSRAGGLVKHLYPARMGISPCVGCGRCAKTGRCVLDDGMQEVYALLEQAHRVVLGTPVYFYGPTAQLKAFIDRCQAMWSRKYLLDQPLPSEILGTERKGYVVAVAASTGKRVFDGVILSARILFDALSLRYSGELLVQGVDEKGAILKQEADLARAVTLGKELGGSPLGR